MPWQFYLYVKAWKLFDIVVQGLFPVLGIYTGRPGKFLGIIHTGEHTEKEVSCLGFQLGHGTVCSTLCVLSVNLASGELTGMP